MKNLLASIKPIIVKHKPEILVGLGVGGFIFAVVSSVKGTVKAVRLVDEKKKELNKDKLTAKETIQTTWKCYIPTAISTAISATCIVLGNNVQNKKNTALAAACSISETALQEYREKAKEVVGPKKEQEIKEAVSKEKIEKTYTPTNVIMTGDGDSLFFEPLSGRYFKSNWNKVLKAANKLNQEALTNVYGEITLNDWFYELGLDDTEIGDVLGWSTDVGLLDISTTAIMTKDDVPCGSIYYNKMPYTL